MYTYSAQLVRVIDGDSIVFNIDLGFNIWLNNTSVRLLGVDTPEKRTKDKLEKFFGYLSTSYVIDRISKASKITIRTELDGKYGRPLAEVFIDDSNISLNTMLIEDRMAVRYNGQSKKLIKDAHIKNWIYLVENNITTLDDNIINLYEQIRGTNG